MSQLYNYLFNNPSRIGNDAYDVSQKNIQNMNSLNYKLLNYRTSCPMTNAVNIATSQPYVNYTGSHQVGINGCNVDMNSKLHITEISRPKCRINLYQRPFATVPYLGRGGHNSVLEAQLQQGHLANNRKSLNLTSELSHVSYRHTPMIHSLQNTITNPNNLIESEADSTWVRGGAPSRDLYKNKEYTH